MNTTRTQVFPSNIRMRDDFPVISIGKRCRLLRMLLTCLAFEFKEGSSVLGNKFQMVTFVLEDSASMKFPRSTIRLIPHISVRLQEILLSFTVLLISGSLIDLWRCYFIQCEMGFSIWIFYYFIEEKTKYVLVTWRAF